MADALKINDQEALRSWLENQPADWARLVALRAALRVFPLVLVGGSQDDFSTSANIQREVLTVWRCLLTSMVAHDDPTDEMRVASNSASAQAGFATTLNAASAAYTSSVCAVSAYADKFPINATAIAVSASVSASSFFSATPSSAWEAIRCDCTILVRDGLEGLASAPLWLRHDHSDVPEHEPRPVIATPKWAAELAVALPDDLVVLLGPEGALIAEWYSGLLSGGSNAYWSRTFLGDRARKLALRKNDFWKVTEERPGETIMGDIAAALAWVRPDPQEVDPQPRDLGSVSELIIRYIESEPDPVSIDMIRARFDRENYPYVDSTLRRELGTLAREGQIQRVRWGWYASATRDARNETQPSARALPPFGKQGAGAKLGIVDGVISLALPNVESGDGNDYDRISKFLPMAREAIEELLASMPEPDSPLQNDPHYRLRKKATEYLRYSEAPLSKVDYELLFGIGTILQNRLAAAEVPSLEPDLAPLTDRQKTALMDFRSTHGPMITASSAAVRIMKDADEFERNPQREREYIKVSADFAEGLTKNPGVVSSETAEFAKDVVEAMGQGDQVERGYIFGAGTVKNIAIVLSAASSVAVLTASGLAILGLAGAALTAPLSLVIIEATKKSRAFKDVSEPVQEFMDTLSKTDGKRLRAFIEDVDGKAMTRFTLQQEDRIRHIIGDRSEYRWLHDQLDWIKANKPSNF